MYNGMVETNRKYYYGLRQICIIMFGIKAEESFIILFYLSLVRLTVVDKVKKIVPIPLLFGFCNLNAILCPHIIFWGDISSYVKGSVSVESRLVYYRRRLVIYV